jgi:hypothetical protein
MNSRQLDPKGPNNGVYYSSLFGSPRKKTSSFFLVFRLKERVKLRFLLSFRRKNVYYSPFIDLWEKAKMRKRQIKLKFFNQNYLFLILFYFYTNKIVS